MSSHRLGVEAALWLLLTSPFCMVWLWFAAGDDALNVALPAVLIVCAAIGDR